MRESSGMGEEAETVLNISLDTMRNNYVHLILLLWMPGLNSTLTSFPYPILNFIGFKKNF